MHLATLASGRLQPPRPRRWWQTLLRALWLVAAALLVLAGLMAMVLQLVVLPHIDSFRPHLERLATRTLGAPVQIGQLVVTKPGWQPEIEMRGVDLQNGHGRSVLHIDTIQAVVSLQAAMRAGFERLTIVAPSVVAHRFADGHVEVAGIRLAEGRQGDSGPLLNWLLSQPELAVADGRLRWSDQQRGAPPPLELTHLQASLKNTGSQHSLILNATPPAGWGQPFQLVSDWSHPFLGDRTAWRKWMGVAYADLPELDVSELRRYLDMGRHIDLREGRGRIKLWANFDQMRTSNLSVDLHLDAADVTLGKDLPPLALKKLDSMLAVQLLSDEEGRETWNLSTSSLQFTTMSDRVWPGGNVRVALRNGSQHADSGGAVEGDNWDLGIIGELARKLPLGVAMLDALDAYQPSGRLQALLLDWQGDVNQPSAWSAKGQADGIGWRAQQGAFNRHTQRFDPGVPGVEGAAVQFGVRHDGGEMQISMRNGAVTLPGVFEQPRLVFDELQAPVSWQIEGSRISAQLPHARFANADVRGSLSAQWRTSDAADGAGAATSAGSGDVLQATDHASAAGAATTAAAPVERFPGVLDLTATLEAARAERVHRYLPLSLGEAARQYVREAVVDGEIRNAKVRIAGDLAHIPYGVDKDGKPYPGTFRFEVPLRNAHYRFVPPSLQQAGELPWPALVKLNGTLIIDRQTLDIVDAAGRFSTAPDLQLSDLAAHIPDLSHDLTVGVAAKASGPLAQALHLANTSPLTDIAHHALEKATATGNTELTLQLGLPIHAMQHAVVEGKVVLKGNDVRIAPNTPLLGKAQGEVAFTQRGFALQKVRAQLLGGNAALEGGLQAAARPGAPKRVVFHAQGDFSAEGVRSEPGLGAVARLAQRMQGRSAYQATLQFDRGAPELTIDSNLNGMALQLPAPLAKGAAGSLPLHLENTVASSYRDGKTGALLPATDRLLARLGNVVSVEYIRDVRSHANRVLRGSIAVGEQAHANKPPLPDSGVHALVLLDAVDVDAWQQVMAQLGEGGDAAGAAAPAAAKAVLARAGKPAGNTPAAAGDAPQGIAAGSPQDYLPTILAIQTKSLRLASRHFDDLVVGGTREGRLWRFSLDARQLSGAVEYLQPAGRSAGALKARLERLLVEPVNVQDVRQIVQQTQDPETLPALDIDARQVDLLGYKFDHVLVLAGNSSQPQAASATLSDAGEDASSNAWRIHQLEATAPHARLQGSGVWGRSATSAAPEAEAGGQQAAPRRFVALNVRLETDNLGSMLEHFGQKDLVAGGAGVLAGNVRWRGSPVSMDMETLGGTLRLDVRRGRITRIDPGAAKMLSLLSIQGLTRLGEMGGKGFAFDRIAGSLRASKGVAHSDDLEVNGALANVKAAGDISLKDQTLQLNVLVQPKIDLGGAALVAAVINPVVGAGSYLAQLVLSKSINSAATQVMTVSGPWQAPKVTRLQGDAARATATQILASRHTAASVVDRLWDWWPVTGGKGYGLPGQDLPALPASVAPAQNVTARPGQADVAPL